MMKNPVVLFILAVLLPPLAVFFKRGAGQDLIINIVLCLLGFLPGVIHAIWLITR